MGKEGDASLESIRRNLGAGELRSSWEKFLERCEDRNLDDLLERVDESDYSLADWVEALLEFDRWLEERNVASRPLSAMVGYVHCCTLTTAKGITSPSLKVCVSQLLTEFGFSHISDPQF